MITLLFSIGALAVLALFFSDLGWNNVLSPARNELVFEGRHRGYGAYVLRREHHRTILVAFLATLGLLGAGVGAPRLFPHGPSEGPVAPPKLDTVDVVLMPQQEQAEQEHRTKARTSERRHDPELIPVAIDSMPRPLPLDTSAMAPRDPGPAGGVGGTPIDSTGNTSGRSGPTTPPPGPVSFAERMPEFQGGDAALQGFWNRNVHFEGWMLDGRKRAVVYVEFVVDANGRVVDARIARGCSAALDRAVLDAVRRMPDWSPGRQGDRPVAVRFTQPVRFTVN